VEDHYLFGSLVNDVINIIRMRIGEKTLRFVTMIDGSLPAKLFGDETRVRQVLLNLLSNAIKYTEKGCVTFSVWGEKPKDSTPHEDFILHFEIKDTGIGIKAENMNKLFGNFMQFDSKRNRGIEGTGLGLAISQNLCRLMGGRLSAESVYGEGSVFTAVIPQKITDGQAFAPVEDAEEKKSLVFDKRKNFSLSVSYTLGTLGVPYTLAETIDDLERELKSGRYQFAFIAWPVAEHAQEILKKHAQAMTVVTMAEYGKKIPLGCRELYMPTQPVMIANVLNGKESRLGFQNTDFQEIRFIAPEARILVVDDIASNIDVATGLLAPYKMAIDRASGGTEAIEMVKKHSYDMVLMDHMMPGMDGIEATALIRAWEKEQQNPAAPALSFGEDETQKVFPKGIPIIALTANAIVGMKDMFLEKGFNDYISKPIEIAKLDDIVGKWIPPEKRIKASVPIKRETFSADPGMIIPGVDIPKGITMTGGTVEGYRKVLARFYKDALERLPLLNSFLAGNSPAGDDFDRNFAAFTTQAHALKSAAAAIGAAEVSEEAAKLEAAGKAGDRAAIQERLPGFVTRLTALAEGIEAALGSGAEAASPAVPKAAAGQNGAPDPALFPLLRELARVLQAENAAAVDSIVEELYQKPLDGKTREALDDVSGDVLMAEYGKAEETVAALLENK
jgi:CheY-like chemotaxis protein